MLIETTVPGTGRSMELSADISNNYSPENIVNSINMLLDEAEGEDGFTCRVLSIKSHVVHGYTGNRIGVFALEVLGFDVDAINSVHLSNHTYYKVSKGQILTADHLMEIMSGLKENELLNYNYIQTGFMKDKSFLLKIPEIVLDLKASNPDLIYVCDPVLGDDGRMCVPAELVSVYKEKILPVADVILPNQMEAEVLGGFKIVDEASALRMLEQLHGLGPRTVVLSSCDINGGITLITYASNMTEEGQRVVVKSEFPKVNARFAGTGDLFAALWLAWSYKLHGDIQGVLTRVLSTMQLVIRRTMKYALDATGKPKNLSWKQLELRIIQSKKDVENPKLVIPVDSIACS